MPNPKNQHVPLIVIPAKAGIQELDVAATTANSWIPAFAGMTPKTKEFLPQGTSPNDAKKPRNDRLSLGLRRGIRS